MFWKTRNGKRYLYQSQRRLGRVHTQYLGTGRRAEIWFEVGQQWRAIDNALLAERRVKQARWQEAAALTNAFAVHVRQRTHTTLHAAGYHLHARSHWRKRTMVQTPVSTPAPAAAAALTDEAILARAQAGDESVRPLLKDVLRRHVDLCREAGDLGLQAEHAWVQYLAASNLVVAAAVPEHLARFKAELAGPAPTPEERLLVDQVALAWLESRCAALVDVAGLSMTIACPKLNEENQRRQDRAQRRYLAALKTLATVRKLLQRSPLRLDLLLRDVPEAVVPRAIQDRAARVAVGVG